MQSVFFVAHAGEQAGPFSLDEIWQKVESKQLELNDYLYDEATQDWVMLMAYPALSEKLKSLKPATPPKPKAPVQAEPSPVSKAVEWFVLKGDHKFGPFTYQDVVKLLQEKSVYEFDYVWNAQLPSWQRVAELNDFKHDVIRKLQESSSSEATELFFRRRHVRVGHGASLIVHDNKTVWKGQTLEVSEGGAGIIIENSLIQPGQSLYIHFKPGDDLPPFNATCEVVSKKFTRVEDRTSPVRYGVKFSKLDANAEKAIKSLTVRKKAA